MTKKKDLFDFDDHYRENFPFGGRPEDFENYARGIHEELYRLRKKVSELQGHDNKIEKLLSEDKSEIIDALENAREKVKIGDKQYDIDTAVEKYQMELEEVLIRVEDQRLVGSKGNIINTKRTFSDFICVLRGFVNMYKRFVGQYKSRENEFMRAKTLAKKRKQRIDELEEENVTLEQQMASKNYDKDQLTIRVAELLREIEELKKPRLPTSLNQKRTIER